MREPLGAWVYRQLWLLPTLAVSPVTPAQVQSPPFYVTNIVIISLLTMGILIAVEGTPLWGKALNYVFVDNWSRTMVRVMLLSAMKTSVIIFLCRQMVIWVLAIQPPHGHMPIVGSFALGVIDRGLVHLVYLVLSLAWLLVDMRIIRIWSEERSLVGSRDHLHLHDKGTPRRLYAGLFFSLHLFGIGCMRVIPPLLSANIDLASACWLALSSFPCVLLLGMIAVALPSWVLDRLRHWNKRSFQYISVLIGLQLASVFWSVRAGRSFAMALVRLGQHADSGMQAAADAVFSQQEPLVLPDMSEWLPPPDPVFNDPFPPVLVHSVRLLLLLMSLYGLYFLLSVLPMLLPSAAILQCTFENPRIGGLVIAGGHRRELLASLRSHLHLFSELFSRSIERRANGREAEGGGEQGEGGGEFPPQPPEVPEPRPAPPPLFGGSMSWTRMSAQIMSFLGEVVDLTNGRGSFRVILPVTVDATNWSEYDAFIHRVKLELTTTMQGAAPSAPSSRSARRRRLAGPRRTQYGFQQCLQQMWQRIAPPPPPRELQLLGVTVRDVRVPGTAGQATPRVSQVTLDLELELVRQCNKESCKLGSRGTR